MEIAEVRRKLAEGGYRTPTPIRKKVEGELLRAADFIGKVLRSKGITVEKVKKPWIFTGSKDFGKPPIVSVEMYLGDYPEEYGKDRWRAADKAIADAGYTKYVKRGGVQQKLYARAGSPGILAASRPDGGISLSREVHEVVPKTESEEDFVRDVLTEAASFAQWAAEKGLSTAGELADLEASRGGVGGISGGQKKALETALKRLAKAKWEKAIPGRSQGPGTSLRVTKVSVKLPARHLGSYAMPLHDLARSMAKRFGLDPKRVFVSASPHGRGSITVTEMGDEVV